MLIIYIIKLLFHYLIIRSLSLEKVKIALLLFLSFKKYFMNIIFMYQLQSLYHRLLCHSLVLSGSRQQLTVDCRQKNQQHKSATQQAMPCVLKPVTKQKTIDKNNQVKNEHLQIK
jgi:hypothetical protein